LPCCSLGTGTLVAARALSEPCAGTVAIVAAGIRGLAGIR
jgi:hypothetical protein